jgi:hypothetical protein
MTRGVDVDRVVWYGMVWYRLGDFLLVIDIHMEVQCDYTWS